MGIRLGSWQEKLQWMRCSGRLPGGGDIWTEFKEWAGGGHGNRWRRRQQLMQKAWREKAFGLFQKQTQVWLELGSEWGEGWWGARQWMLQRGRETSRLWSALWEWRTRKGEGSVEAGFLLEKQDRQVNPTHFSPSPWSLASFWNWQRLEAKAGSSEMLSGVLGCQGNERLKWRCYRGGGPGEYPGLRWGL